MRAPILDPDTQRLVERAMRERRVSFKEALNDAIRVGLGSTERGMELTVPRDLGTPTVDVTKALALAGELDDAAIARQMAEGR